MSQPLPKVAYLTAGAAGMYCGSCMHDNTLAAALCRSGVDVQLIPLYTPIRTDEEDISVDRLFFGGVNLYLQHRFGRLGRLPNALARLLDRPPLLRWLTAHGGEPDPGKLGELTVSMLQGEHAYLRSEIDRLCRWLASFAPDLIVLTNMLLGGAIPQIKRRLGVPVLVTLQGDDVFLEQLQAPHRSRALDEICRRAEQVDGFIANSRYYADFMAGYFKIPRDKIHIVPLGIDTRDFQQAQHRPSTQDRAGGPAIGYLARLAPEKGLHLLVDAFIELRKRPGMEDVQLRVAGWLGRGNRRYAESQFAKLEAAGAERCVQFAGSVDRRAKMAFLAGLDVLCVPTTYREPKGLYVLESLAAGVPVVVPDHGAFPEMIQATGGGWLVRPGDPAQLAQTLADVLADPRTRAERGRSGATAVHQRRNAQTMAQATLQVYARFL